MSFSCVKKTAQFPANKGNTIDSTDINLRIVNESLTQKEDSILEILANNQKTKFNKTPSGIWYYKETKTELDPVQKYPSISFSYILFTVNGVKVDSGKKTVNFEKKEIPIGLEEGLKLMRKREKMRLIVPWYLAYGMKGESNIPPYTSLIYEIEIGD